MPDAMASVDTGLAAPTVEGVRGVGDEPIERDAARIEAMLSTPLFFGVDAMGPLGGFVLATLQRVRLKDRQLRHATSEMTARNAQAADLQRGLEILHAIRSIGNAGDGDSTAAWTDLARSGVVRPSDGDLRGFVARLNDEYGLRLSPHDEDGTLVIGPESLDASIQQLNSRINRLNTSTELDMINLQSTLESRSNELRVISQVLDGEHDTLRSVIGNIG